MIYLDFVGYFQLLIEQECINEGVAKRHNYVWNLLDLAGGGGNIFDY